ncbi:unnamed protein product [Oikopleura dioica]|uniref:Uncharacterized protein n=1 Tax=Oikopleura dioica TaxID=34765 RepID=E4YLC4_OIKDI|nr:unnamed protein product [Oikopleura dioica]
MKIFGSKATSVDAHQRKLCKTIRGTVYRRQKSARSS